MFIVLGRLLTFLFISTKCDSLWKSIPCSQQPQFNGSRYHTKHARTERNWADGI